MGNTFEKNMLCLKYGTIGSIGSEYVGNGYTIVSGNIRYNNEIIDFSCILNEYDEKMNNLTIVNWENLPDELTESYEMSMKYREEIINVAKMFTGL